MPSHLDLKIILSYKILLYLFYIVYNKIIDNYIILINNLIEASTQ
jgi:hypothetical protein